MAKKRERVDMVHRWAGMIVFVFLAIQAITGFIIVDNDRAMRVVDPESFALSEPFQGDIDLGMLYEVASEKAEGPIVSFLYPKDNKTAVTAIIMPPFVDGRPSGPPEFVSMDPASGEIMGQKPIFANITFIANLVHERLIIGPVGQFILMIVGAALVALSITGVWRWWPGFNKLGKSMAMLKPTGKLSTTLWRWHAPIGAIFAIAFLWLGITGTLIAGRQVLEPTLSLVADTRPMPTLGAITVLDTPPKVDKTGIEAAYLKAKSLGEGFKIAAFTPANAISENHQFVFSDPVKRVAVVTMSPAGEVLDTYLPSDSPAASSLFDWAVPLHKGEFLPKAVKYTFYLIAMALLLMAISGLSINRTKASARKKRKKMAKAAAAGS